MYFMSIKKNIIDSFKILNLISGIKSRWVDTHDISFK